MPNCDFYAVPADHRPLLEWLFAERTCRVYELSSEFEQPLRQFQSADDILREFERRHPGGERWTTVHLQLEVINAGPPFTPRRVALDPQACGGAHFRYAAEGWGLVQLYLAAPENDRLESSHTNHNSKTRAEAWAPGLDLPDAPGAWDFARIASFSRRLNRQIRKAAVARIGSRVILAGALQVWEAGLPLWPYTPGENALTFEKNG